MQRKGDEKSGAEFSECERYRYSLWRTWTPAGLDGRLCAFIGLNPSTATHEMDDPTIRRCIRFCKDWGYDGYVMLNLFAFRATDPRVMKAAEDPVGPESCVALPVWADYCEMVVCAWGVHGAFKTRGLIVKEIVRGPVCRDIHHLGLTKDGYPKHPLYLPADTQPVRWD